MEKAVELSTVSRHELVWHEAHAALSSNLLPSAKINGKDRNRHMYASRWYGVVILPDQAHSGFDTTEPSPPQLWTVLKRNTGEQRRK